MSRKTKRFKRKLLVPFEWFGIGIALCVIRRHPSCWILNYNYFSHIPSEDDLRTLKQREARV